MPEKLIIDRLLFHDRHCKQAVMIFIHFRFSRFRFQLEAWEEWDLSTRFILQDICESMGIRNTYRACRPIEHRCITKAVATPSGYSMRATEKGGMALPNASRRPQLLLMVSVEGEFQLLITSRKPLAKEFRAWLPGRLQLAWDHAAAEDAAADQARADYEALQAARAAFAAANPPPPPRKFRF